MAEKKVLENETVQAEVQAMLDMDEPDLERLLGRRVQAIEQDVSLSLEPTFEVQAGGMEALTLPPWVQHTVDRIINTALRQTHSVLCSDEPDFATLRAKLTGALGLGGSAAVLAFAGFLTSTLGIAAALATVVATILIKKIGEPALSAGLETMCQELDELLPE